MLQARLLARLGSTLSHFVERIPRLRLATKYPFLALPILQFTLSVFPSFPLSKFINQISLLQTNALPLPIFVQSTSRLLLLDLEPIILQMLHLLKTIVTFPSCEGDLFHLY
jgi:hypothetical protein